MSSHVLRAQMESLVVESVSDLSIGLSPSKAAYINTADLMVPRRWLVRGEKRIATVDRVWPVSCEGLAVEDWPAEDCNDCPIQ